MDHEKQTEKEQIKNNYNNNNFLIANQYYKQPERGQYLNTFEIFNASHDMRMIIAQILHLD